MSDDFKGLGTTITPGSNAYRAFRGVGSMKAGKMRDTVPAFLGGGLAAGASLGLRAFAAPLGSDGQPSIIYKYAPLLGAAAGVLLGGGASWALAGKGGSGMSAALGSAVTAIVVGGALYAEDLRLASLTSADMTTHLQVLGSPAILSTTPSPATTAGVSMMHVDPRTRRPVAIGAIQANVGVPGGRPPLYRVGHVNENAYGASPYGGR